MPRGRGKGGNKRKKGKAMQARQKRDLEFKEEGQEYAQVLRLLGNGRVECNCMDGKKRMCTIRGATVEFSVNQIIFHRERLSVK